MIPTRTYRAIRCGVAITLIAWAIIACSPSPSTSTGTPTSASAGTPTDIWRAMLERTPYPYKTPLPLAVASPLDGTYVKEEPMVGERIHCRRCPDWGHDGGLWKLRFDKGIYLVLYVDAGWRSLGSFTVSGNRVMLFNDPVCGDETGAFEWRVEKGKLTFREIDDPCFIHLRAENLMWQPWLSCQPPNIEAAVTDHWEKPKGCE